MSPPSIIWVFNAIFGNCPTANARALWHLVDGFVNLFTLELDYQSATRMGRTSDAKEKLLQVAFDLIWQQSYGAVSVDDICVRAKVKKGSFYHFFPSKSDLAVAAYEEHWQAIRPRYDGLFSPLVPP